VRSTLERRRLPRARPPDSAHLHAGAEPVRLYESRVDREAPVGFSAIRLSFDLDAEADEDQLATLSKLTERYCVVYQTLACTPAVSTTVAIA
jgi:uncharacterized OsmC-like protein